MSHRYARTGRLGKATWPGRRRRIVLGVLVAAGVTALLVRALSPTGKAPSSPSATGHGVAALDSGEITPAATRTMDGVPVGWPHTRHGAVAAAAGYARVLSALWFLTDPGRRYRAVARMAAPEAAAGLQASQDALADAVRRGPFGAGLARPQVTSLLRTSLLGYRVDHYDPSSATVAVWAVVIYGNDGGMAPQAIWATSTLRLRWVGDWKLLEVGTVPGPTPVHGQATPSPAADLIRAAGTFEEFRDAPAQ